MNLAKSRDLDQWLGAKGRPAASANHCAKDTFPSDVVSRVTWSLHCMGLGHTMAQSSDKSKGMAKRRPVWPHNAARRAASKARALSLFAESCKPPSLGDRPHQRPNNSSNAQLEKLTHDNIATSSPPPLPSTT